MAVGDAHVFPGFLTPVLTTFLSKATTKNMDKWGYIYLTVKKTLWEKEKLLVTLQQCFQNLSVVDASK